MGGGGGGGGGVGGGGGFCFFFFFLVGCMDVSDLYKAAAPHAASIRTILVSRGALKSPDSRRSPSHSSSLLYLKAWAALLEDLDARPRRCR